MDNSGRKPVKHRKPILTLEFSRVQNFGDEDIEVLMSIPGADGIVEARWKCDMSALRPGERQDMYAWILNRVSSALFRSGGLQEVLPL